MAAAGSPLALAASRAATFDFTSSSCSAILLVQLVVGQLGRALRDGAQGARLARLADVHEFDLAVLDELLGLALLLHAPLGVVLVHVGDLVRVALGHDVSLVEQDGARAEGRDPAHVVRDHDDGLGRLQDLGDALAALLLELVVAGLEDLVEKQDVRVHRRGDGEAHAGPHARGVGLHGRVDEGADVGEGDDPGVILPP